MTLPAELQALRQGTAFVTAYATACGFPPTRVQQLALAVGEALANICAYAYPQSAGEVCIQCAYDETQRLAVTIVDGGVPFNLLTVPPPDLLADLDTRTLGGLGIFLLRNLVDEVSYRREHEHNIVCLVLSAAV
ncbi:MAG: ATP-binding protein [Candidatus Tectimicrobiota bacterium]